MSKNDIYAIFKDDETTGGVKPLAKPSATVTPPTTAPAATVTPPTTAPAATVTPIDTKTTVTPSEPVTPTVTHPAAGYVGSDYSDWHKHYSGTEWDGSSPMMAKPDWMSTTDYNRGMIHYLYGQKYDKIQGDYDAAVGAADGIFYRTSEKAEDAYRSEMAYNGVLYERMKKYMPLQQKRAGMGNMGVAQTGLAQITNDHMNRRSAIQGQYNDAIADASFARATEVGAAERARANSMSDLNALTTEEMMKIYAGEEADAEAKQQADIAAFEASITSYSDKDTALADLETLGLEATDPEYIALKTQIEGYFRDKTTSSYNNAMEEIWNYPDSKAALEYINTLDTTGWTEQQIAQLKARAELLDYKSPEEIAQGQENALAAYNSQLAIMIQTNSGNTDAMYTLLESFKDRLSPDAYATAKMELDAYKNDPQRQYETRQNEMSQQEYIDDMLMLDAADKAGYSNVDEYIEAIVGGEIPIQIQGQQFYVKNAVKNPAFMAIDDDLNDSLSYQGYHNGYKDKSIPDGTVVYAAFNWYAKYGDYWYRLKSKQ